MFHHIAMAAFPKKAMMVTFRSACAGARRSFCTAVRYARLYRQRTRLKSAVKNIFLQRPIIAIRVLIAHANSSLLHQKNTEKVLNSG
jgi:hypothetical protein